MDWSRHGSRSAQASSWVVLACAALVTGGAAARAQASDDLMAGLAQSYDQPYEGAAFPMAPAWGHRLGVTEVTGAALGSVTPDAPNGVARVIIESGGPGALGDALIAEVRGLEVEHGLTGGSPFGVRAAFQGLGLASGDAATGASGIVAVVARGNYTRDDGATMVTEVAALLLLNLTATGGESGLLIVNVVRYPESTGVPREILGQAVTPVPPTLYAAVVHGAACALELRVDREVPRVRARLAAGGSGAGLDLALSATAAALIRTMTPSDLGQLAFVFNTYGPDDSLEVAFDRFEIFDGLADRDLGGLPEIYDQPYDGRAFPMTPDGGTSGLGLTRVLDSRLAVVTPDASNGTVLAAESVDMATNGAFAAGVEGPQIPSVLSGERTFGARARFTSLSLQASGPPGPAPRAVAVTGILVGGPCPPSWGEAMVCELGVSLVHVDVAGFRLGFLLMVVRRYPESAPSEAKVLDQTQSRTLFGPSDPVYSAILRGDAYAVELVVDRDSPALLGRVTVGEQPAIGVTLDEGSLSEDGLELLATWAPLRVGQLVILVNQQGADDQVSVRFDRFQVFADSPGGAGR